MRQTLFHPLLFLTTPSASLWRPVVFWFLFLGSCFLALISCGPAKDDTHTKHAMKQINEDSLRKQFMKANQMVIQKENDEMDYYGKTHKMPFIKTSSGIRYYVYKASEKGDSIGEGSLISMDYKVSLLDGTECYSSTTEGKKTFEVGHENIESGIHKGVQYLKKGDHAILLIPSHLAHGLLGDMKKIPPQVPILYDIQISQ
ncbi:MAG: peptidylprolyl isomerase [Bacteroidetes bacterium]|jgi:FKBP-type peptidyl-prolyl cis-trans isomerase|nr:peptidylprolyl isomerase [Bacteroidota bacterium]